MSDSKNFLAVWLVAAALLLIWSVLKFLLHKGGFVHILLLTSISLFVVQVAAYRKAKYQKQVAER